MSAAADQSGRDDAFVSYSRRDVEFVRRLRDALNERGKRLWVDLEDIPPTADWRAKVHAGLEQARNVIFVISPDSIASRVCTEELDGALALRKRLIPIVCRDVESKDVRRELKAPNWISFEDATKFDASLDTLATALETDLAWLDAHARYSVLAGDWTRRNHDPSLLLRGDDLRAAEAWLAASAAQPEAATENQVAFILASRRAAGQRRRVLGGAVLAALGISIALAIFAALQRNDAIAREKVARAQALSTAAVGQLDVDPELSVLLAREAVEERAIPQAVDVLRRSLSESKVRLRLHAGRALAGADFSGDGESIVTTTTENEPFRAVRWDAVSGARRGSVGEQGEALKLGFGSAFSPSGSEVVIWSGRTARLWSLTTGKRIAVLRGTGKGDFGSASFSANGKLVVTAGAGAVARIWRAADGKLIRRFGHPPDYSLTGAVFSDDGKLVAGSADNRFWIWPASGGPPVGSNLHRRQNLQIDDLAFSPGGRYLATFGRPFFGEDEKEAELGVWRVPDGHKLVVIRPGNTFSGFAFSPGEKTIVTAGPGDNALLWSLPRGAPLSALRGHTGAVESVTFSPDGSLLATASADGTARVWNTRTRATVLVLRGHRSRVVDAEFSPDGHRLVTAGADGTARVWQLDEGGPTLRGIALAVSTDGKLALTATPPAAYLVGRTIRPTADLRNVTTGRRLAVLKAKLHYPVAGAFSGDGALVATGSGRVQPRTDAALALEGEHAVRVWRTSDGQQVARIPTEDAVLNVALSRDGKLVLAGEDGAGELFRVSDGRRIRLLSTPPTDHPVTGQPNFAEAFSSDGTHILSVAPGLSIRLFPAQAGGAPTILAHSALASAAALDSDGTRVVGTSETQWTRLWHTGDGSLERTLEKKGTEASAFSPDGSLVAVAGDDGMARVWRTADGEQVAVLAGHQGPVDRISFSPDGTEVLTSGQDGTSRLFDALTGDELVVYQSPSLGFTSRGAVVETPTAGTVRVVPCETCGSVKQLLALARRRVTRDLTCEERRTYLNRAC
jgi:WD40 repeat protein